MKKNPSYTTWHWVASHHNQKTSVPMNGFLGAPQTISCESDLLLFSSCSSRVHQWSHSFGCNPKLMTRTYIDPQPSGSVPSSPRQATLLLIRHVPHVNLQSLCTDSYDSKQLTNPLISIMLFTMLNKRSYWSGTAHRTSQFWVFVGNCVSCRTDPSFYYVPRLCVWKVVG